MNVKFITTSKDDLDTLDVVNGQLIYVSDAQQGISYYDLGGVRHAISGNVLVSQLPETGVPGLLYLLLDGSTVHAYVWDTDRFADLTSGTVKRELTFEEYSNLPEEEKYNGMIYFVKDIDSGYHTIINDEVVSTTQVYSSAKVDSIVSNVSYLPDYENAKLWTGSKLSYAADSNCIVTGSIKLEGDQPPASIVVQPRAGQQVVLQKFEGSTTFYAILRKDDVIGFISSSQNVAPAVESLDASIIPLQS